MVDLFRCKLKTSENILRFQKGIIFENFGVCHARAEQIKHILDPNPGLSNAGTYAALIGIESNAAEMAQLATLLPSCAKGNSPPTSPLALDSPALAVRREGNL
jgi:hypothetical protein